MKFKPKEWIAVRNVGEQPYNSPWTLGGKTFSSATIVSTPESLAAVAAAFNKEGKPHLVDEEHFHVFPDQSSGALGWILEAKADDKFLYCRVDWTDKGRAKVESGELRYISDCMDCALANAAEKKKGVPNITPKRLTGAGLTNTPRNKALPPISDAVDATPEDTARFMNRDTAAPVPTTEQNQTPTESPDDETPEPMDPKIIAKLGLGPNATVDDVVAALDQLQKDAASAKSDAVEATMNAYKDVIPQGREASFREGLTTNRKFAVECLDALRTQASTTSKEVEKKDESTTEEELTKPVFNKATAKAPEVAVKDASKKPEAERTPEEHAEVFNSQSSGPERSAYYKKYRPQIMSVK